MADNENIDGRDEAKAEKYLKILERDKGNYNARNRFDLILHKFYSIADIPVEATIKKFMKKTFFELLSTLYKSKYKDYFMSSEEEILTGGNVLSLKLKSKLFNKNIAIKVLHYEKDTAPLEYYFYSKFRKFFRNDNSVEVPKPIIHFETKIRAGLKDLETRKRDYVPTGVLVTQYADCTPLTAILENKALYGSKFKGDILDKIIKTTSQVHNVLGEFLKWKTYYNSKIFSISSYSGYEDFWRIYNLEKNQEYNNYQEVIENNFRFDDAGGYSYELLMFKNFLEGYKDKEIWIKDIKPANWGYNF